MQVQNNLQICIGHLIGIIIWPTQVRISPLFLALLPQILKHTHYVLDQVGLLLVLMDSSNPSVCVCKSTKKMHLISTKNKKGSYTIVEKRAPYLATPSSKYIQDFSQEITLSIEFSTTTSSSIYYKTTVAKLHENTKIWSRPTLVQQSAIEREDAIESKRKKEKLKQ